MLCTDRYRNFRIGDYFVNNEEDLDSSKLCIAYYVHARKVYVYQTDINFLNGYAFTDSVQEQPCIELHPRTFHKDLEWRDDKGKLDAKNMFSIVLLEGKAEQRENKASRPPFSSSFTVRRYRGYIINFHTR